MCQKFEAAQVELAQMSHKVKEVQTYLTSQIIKVVEFA